MLDLTNLTDAVTKTEGVEASAKALIIAFAAEVLTLSQNQADPAALADLASRMNAAADDLSAAVAANPST
jgi:hypothetical protein